MCGIFGFIGKSRKPELSHEIASALFVKTEKRGEHATGFWACERGDGKVFYDKEPVKATQYIRNDIWSKRFAHVDSDLLIAHCRLTSANVGHEKYNKNNHPHVSEDRRIALVHNGKITEYSQMKPRYELRSDCDSEILLGMFEYSDGFRTKDDLLKQQFPNLPPEIACRMLGMREIFSRVNYSAMAVAVAERSDDGKRYLWLFCDGERPLHVIDMRKTLGQIFFCSEPEIWKAATELIAETKKYLNDNLPVVIFPPHHVWLMAMEPNSEEKAKSLAWESLKDCKKEDDTASYQSPEDVPTDIWNDALAANADSWRIKKFRISKTKFYDWNPNEDGEKVKRAKARQPKLTIVTRLSDNDELKSDKDTVSTTMTVSSPKKKVVTQSRISSGADSVRDFEGDVDRHAFHDDDLSLASRNEKDEALDDLHEVETEGEIDMKAFEILVGQLKDVLADIDTTVRNLEQEGTLSQKEFVVISDSIKDSINELKANLLFLRQ